MIPITKFRKNDVSQIHRNKESNKALSIMQKEAKDLA